MAAARAFEGKTATIADLPPATVYALASPSVPETTRAQLVSRMEGGERLSESAIRDVLWEAQQERKKAAAAAKLTPEQRARKKNQEAKAKAARDKAAAQQRDEAAARKLATERAAKLIAEHLARSWPDGAEWWCE